MLEEIYGELEKLGLTSRGEIKLEEIRRQNGVSVYRVVYQNYYYVLKYFTKMEFTREIKTYSYLSELGIHTIKTFGYTDKAILLEDVDKSEDYRLGIAEDLSDIEVARALAKWYCMLHSRGVSYIVENSNEYYREIDNITKKNIKMVMEKSNTRDNKVWEVVLNNIELIVEKTKALGETLTYNDFYWTNLIVKKDKSEAFMFDYNLLGIGLRYFDIRNVTASMSKESGEAFIKEYGGYNQEEKLIDNCLSPLFTLIAAYERTEFPKWGYEYLEMISSGKLESDFKEVVKLLL